MYERKEDNEKMGKHRDLPIIQLQSVISAEKTKQRQRNPERDKGERAEVEYFNKLQVPWSNCFR